jgi:hypothetical protein
MTDKREKIVKILQENYRRAAAAVNNGDWSKEAVNLATATRMVWAGYATWVDTNPPEGASHPTETFFNED